MFSLSGRDAIAEPGALPFFRSLAPGDQGEDVLELKQILAASGDDPGAMDNYFSQQTQFALAQWQAQHHYPNTCKKARAVAPREDFGMRRAFFSRSRFSLSPHRPCSRPTASIRTPISRRSATISRKRFPTCR